jgi:glycosyltransferase involved in cell wall biosynthesis
MGAQNYQRQIIQRAPLALAMEGSDIWPVRHLAVRSLRSALPGNRRLPFAAVTRAGPSARRAVGRLLYGGSPIVHRMSLELPPSPQVDVVTLHDVVAWRFPDESAPVPASEAEVRRAAAVICVSEFSAQEAVDLLGVRDPHVVHNGVDERFFDAPRLPNEQLQMLGIDGPYVLHVGGAAKRKNLEALADAWPRVRRERLDLQLVLAGPAHPRRTELFARLPGAALVGRVHDDLLPGLIAGASVVVVPSLYEGFGLPVLEAMAANVAVVAASTSSLPEVSGDAAVLVPPTAAGIAEGLLDATSGDSAIDALRSKGRARAAHFSWDRSAREHAQVWRSLV